MRTLPTGKTQGDEADEPLPLTLRFVMALGGVIVIGWFLMFLLLQNRW